MIRKGCAANLRICRIAGLEDEFQFLVQLAEGQLLIWNVNGRYRLRIRGGMSAISLSRDSEWAVQRYILS